MSLLYLVSSAMHMLKSSKYCTLSTQVYYARELIEPTFSVDANSYIGRACTITFESFINGVRQQVHWNTFNCCLPHLWCGKFQLGGMESGDQDILLAWQIVQLTSKFQRRTEPSWLAWWHGGKIIRNDGWSFQKWGMERSFWMGANQRMSDTQVEMTRSSLRSYRPYFDWKTLFSARRLLFSCILLYL